MHTVASGFTAEGSLVRAKAFEELPAPAQLEKLPLGDLPTGQLHIDVVFRVVCGLALL